MPSFRLLAAGLLLQVILHAQTRPITADASRPAGPHSDVPLFCVGAGRASEALYPEWQAQLTTLQREIGFRYLRFHGILSDEMGLYKEDAAGNPVYDFTRVDQVYDILLARHIKPFVELTFMPKALASGTHTIFWYSANVTPPKDMQKWQLLVRELTKHWIARYGLPEVQSWYFEVWNEPELPVFLLRKHAAVLRPLPRHGDRSEGGLPCMPRWRSSYLQSKRHTVPHLPERLSHADRLLLHSHLRRSQARNRRPGPYRVRAGPLTGFRHPPSARPARADRPLRQPAASHPPHGVEFLLPSRRLFSTISTGSAPFILDHVRRGSVYTASMSYWIFTDIFEERGPQTKPFYGGFGLFNLEGIRKPSFFAYKYLSQLGPTDLTTADPASQSWITIAPGPKQPSVQALFWDYTPISPPSGQIDQTFYKKEIPAPPVRRPWISHSST